MEASEDEFTKPLGFLEEWGGGGSRYPDAEQPHPVAEAGWGRTAR